MVEQVLMAHESRRALLAEEDSLLKEMDAAEKAGEWSFEGDGDEDGDGDGDDGDERGEVWDDDTWAEKSKRWVGANKRPNRLNEN